MKNKYEIKDDNIIVFIKQRNGESVSVILDEKGFNKIQENKYSLSAKWDDKRKVYRIITKVVLNGKPRNEYLYRFIMDAPKGLVVDHINHDTLDNRYENMRVVTHKQNEQNRKGADRDSISKVRNVWYDKKENKWAVCIRKDGKNHHFGRYETIEQAEIVATENRKILLPYAM